MYKERPSRVPGGFVWSSVSTGDDVRVLPDGCIDFLWDGEHISIAGPDTHAQLFASESGSQMTGLRFAPGDAPRLLGVPAHELTDQRVGLDQIWEPARVRRVAELVAASAVPGDALETVALQFRPDPDDDAVLVEQIVALAQAGYNSSAIADRVGFSARQLQRRSTAAFGYGAKTLGRILRLRRALALVHAGVRTADSAARAGYADQSHLAREVKDLAGVTITQLV
jgi:AraC-like DNA-binding protein